jgi:serine/threonine protein kinase
MVLKVTNQTVHQSSSLLNRLIGDHDRYRLESLLGKGGMGEVYKATDTRLGKDVAIKLLKTSLSSSSTTAELEFKRRFERECAICAALKSENIVQVSDYGITSEGLPFYVMDYLEGQTLAQTLKHESKLSIERTKSIVTQVCAGLSAAHEGITFKASGMSTEQRIKIIHRDLKPANIFLVPTALGERAKLIDFGVAKIQSLHIENPNLTRAFLGTHHYSAPEQFDGQGNIDERSDIYCLGIILYEMLTGTDPFGLKSHEQKISGESWLKAHLLDAVQPLRSQSGCEHLSVELEQIVMRCLEKHPDQRFPSVKALAQSLDDVQNTTYKPINLFRTHRIKKDSSLTATPHSSQKKIGMGDIHQWIAAKFSRNRFTWWIESLKELNFAANLLEYSSRKSCTPMPFKLSVINSQLIDKCHTELNTYIGPIAKLIIEQTLNNTKYRQPQEFIEALASQIPDINAANRFRQTFFMPSADQCLSSHSTTAGGSLASRPNANYRYPFFGFGLKLPFQVHLQDLQVLLTSEKLLKVLMLLKARPWLQFMLVLLMSANALAGIGFLIGVAFSKPPSPPTLSEFKPNSFRHVEGGRIHLSWKIANADQIQQLIIYSTKDQARKKPLVYDFRQGLPTELYRFCQMHDRDLTCNKFDIGARLKGKYTFYFQLKAKSAEQSTQKELRVTVLPKPLPKVKGISSSSHKSKKKQSPKP